MTLDIAGQISKLDKEKWVNLQGLVDCSVMFRSSAGCSSPCQSISLLGAGSYNTVYRLSFDDGFQFAACVSNSPEGCFNSQAKVSEIETMKFVRESGLYPEVPIPKVHAWDTTFNNAVGAPYILMDVVEGETVHNFNALTSVQQLSIVNALAKLKASLSKPAPFKKLGSIIADPAGEGFSLGPLMTLSQRCLGGPFESADELWRTRLDHGMLYAIQEWCTLKKDELPGLFEPKCTPQTFTEIFQLLSALIPYFKIPQAYNTLVLHHPDIALRNVLFDKESLLSNKPKITGVLDWAGAQILPLMLTAHNFDDVMTSAHSPFLHASLPHEFWNSVPYHWTFAGDSTQWPKAIRSTGVPFDYGPGVTDAVRLFYLRTYFSACYAQQLHALHGDTSLPHATLFADAPYYLKFHETVCGGWENWVEHATWIRETYWRLRTRAGQTSRKELLITGPNVYRDSIEVEVCDLGMPKDSEVHIRGFHNS